MADSFKTGLSDKPHLSKLLEENKELAKEVVGTFVQLMEYACEHKWYELPKQLHKDLTFNSLVNGILKGSLDLPDINHDAYDALKIEVHPLAMLTPRKNYIDGGYKLFNWRNHFGLPPETNVSEDTVAGIFRKLLRYSRYVKINDLAKALEYNQLATFRGLGERNVELLPFYPAIRYQKEVFGDLHAGKFFDEVGFLDCGDWIVDGEIQCPACSHETIETIGKYKICLTCNAGFEVKEL